MTGDHDVAEAKFGANEASADQVDPVGRRWETDGRNSGREERGADLEGFSKGKRGPVVSIRSFLFAPALCVPHVFSMTL